MIDPERIGESFAQQTDGPLPSGLGAGGLAARHQRRVRRRRAAGGVAVLAVVAGGAFALPQLNDDSGGTFTEVVAEEPATATPTTEDPVKVEEATEGAEAQDEALADGEVTEAEYENAVAEYRACTERVEEAACYDFHIGELDEAISEAGGIAPPPTVTAPGTETVESILIPTGEWSVTEVTTNTHAIAAGGPLALLTTEAGPSGPLVRITLNETVSPDALDGVSEVEAPGSATVFEHRVGDLAVTISALGVDRDTVEAIATAVTIEDGAVGLPAAWPEGFEPVEADHQPTIVELFRTDGPGNLFVTVVDGSTRTAHDAIAVARIGSATERTTQVALVTADFTFVADGDRLYMLHIDDELSDAVVGSLAPIALDELRTELGLLPRAETYDLWLEATPLPEGHTLELLRYGLTINPEVEALTAHALFQCAWIDRWVETGDPANLEPVAGRDAWPTAAYLSEEDRALFDVARDLLGDGATVEERLADPAVQRCDRYA